MLKFNTKRAIPGLPDPIMLPDPAPLMRARYDFERVGYAAEEFLIRGEAMDFSSSGLGSLDELRIDSSARYCTRLLVFRPKDLARYRGTVVVEWLNVRADRDFASEWLRTHRHLMRRGIIWVGVSAQRAGLEGGSNRLAEPAHLKILNPERYASIEHPGDAYAFDIFSQAGLLVRGGGLSFSAPECLLAVASSEAARFMTTYINRIDPSVRAFDGFLISGRHRSSATLSGDSICGSRVFVREDVRVPVFVVQTETDPFGRMKSFDVRQEDTDHFRLWEIAGAAHADTYLFNASTIDDGLRSAQELARAYDPARVVWVRPRLPINASPAYHYVERAALHHLELWARFGYEPPAGVVLRGSPSKGIERDHLGVALGGVRTPWVDCPAQIYSGVNEESGESESLFGCTMPLPPHTLAQLYPGDAADYVEKFEVALQRSIGTGFILEDDAAENLQLASALFDLIGSGDGPRLCEATAQLSQ